MLYIQDIKGAAMPQFDVTLKRTIYATVKVEAETLADARRQFEEEEERWQAFNGMGDNFHGEETKLVKVSRHREPA
jgi:hypothetical protein